MTRNARQQKLIELINAAITVLNSIDSSQQNEINKLDETVSTKCVQDAGSGLALSAATGGGRTISLKLGNSGPLKYDDVNEKLTIVYASPLKLDSTGALTIDTSVLIQDIKKELF